MNRCPRGHSNNPVADNGPSTVLSGTGTLARRPLAPRVVSDDHYVGVAGHMPWPFTSNTPKRRALPHRHTFIVPQGAPRNAQTLRSTTSLTRRFAASAATWRSVTNENADHLKKWSGLSTSACQTCQ
jgi:hypothetical protein